MTKQTISTVSYSLVALSQNGDKARYNATDGSKYSGLYGEIYVRIDALNEMFGGIPTVIDIPMPTVGNGVVVASEAMRNAYRERLIVNTALRDNGSMNKGDVCKTSGREALEIVLRPVQAPKPVKVRPANVKPSRTPVALAADTAPELSVTLGNPAPVQAAQADMQTEARFMQLEQNVNTMMQAINMLVQANGIQAESKPASRRVTGKRQ